MRAVAHPWVTPCQIYQKIRAQARFGVLVLIALCLSVTNATVLAYEIESDTFFPAIEESHSAAESQRLEILSTGDIDQFKPIIDDFQIRNPSVAIRYVTASSTEVMRAIYDEQVVFDIAISSAMDLHTKLANDGYAQVYESAQTQVAPDFARWRNEVFTFTEEPAAFVVSKKAFEGLDIPTTRQALITILRKHAERFRGKIGTYDIRQSGLGYLFAGQDARNSDTYWRLTEVMGALGVKTYCCSSQMIQDVAEGDIAIAYNVLGSYAATRAEQDDSIQVVLPTDYTLLMQRSVLIPKTSVSPALAGSFIDHLLELAWQSEDESVYPFPRLSTEDPLLSESHVPIRLGPGLLVYLDKAKRSRFVREWEDSLLQK